jgi:hypothetical protein
MARMHAAFLKGATQGTFKMIMQPLLGRNSRTINPYLLL